MAVREGFEPSIQLLTIYSLSRGAPSASRPPHLKLCYFYCYFYCNRPGAKKNRSCYRVAHILRSRIDKSNNFSCTLFICTIPIQSVAFTDKAGISDIRLKSLCCSIGLLPNSRFCSRYQKIAREALNAGLQFSKRGYRGRGFYNVVQ